MLRRSFCHGAVATLFLFICPLSGLHAQASRDSTRADSARTAGATSIEMRVDSLLGKMTLEEKIDMIGGVEDFYTRPNERLGIPKIKLADGPLGVRNYGQATAFPA